MRFTKMQGLGNDYVYLDCTREGIADPAALSRRISDRHFGVGSDGLILILPGERADFRMRMFNADGSEAEMCGNGVRCIGKYVYERGLTEKTEITLETLGGVKTLRLRLEGKRVRAVSVDMGVPVFAPEEIPAKLPSAEETALREIRDYPIVHEGQTFRITCVNVGNPHCVVFQDEVEEFDLAHWGPLFECSPLFPRRINTEFVQVKDREHLRMRVWERGSGETLACGTGACATLAAAVINGLAERRAFIQLNGGELEIVWEEETGHLWMTGPAEFVFDGELLN